MKNTTEQQPPYRCWRMSRLSTRSRSCRCTSSHQFCCCTERWWNKCREYRTRSRLRRPLKNQDAIAKAAVSN